MNAQRMRQNADQCFDLADKHKDDAPKRLRYMRMATAWQDLADNQDWLDGALPAPAVVPAIGRASSSGARAKWPTAP